MRPKLLVGTTEGLHDLSEGGRQALTGREVTSLAKNGSTWWTITDRREVRRRGKNGAWRSVASSPKWELNCLLPTATGLLVGTEKAHLLQLQGKTLEPVPSFERAPGREDWYTPWGGAPDVRSISEDPSGTLYVNVHVGGVARSNDGGKSWQSTIDVDSDVHQVLFDAASGLLLAPSLRGLGLSPDRGETWHFHRKGLHGDYLRAVAVAGETILVTASTGPFTNHAAVYRRGVTGEANFERCRSGLPDRFSHNIDTFCLAAKGSWVAFGTEEGSTFFSTDEGRTWSEAANDLPPVRCVAFA